MAEPPETIFSHHYLHLRHRLAAWILWQSSVFIFVPFRSQAVCPWFFLSSISLYGSFLPIAPSALALIVISPSIFIFIFPSVSIGLWTLPISPSFSSRSLSEFNRTISQFLPTCWPSSSYQLLILVDWHCSLRFPNTRNCSYRTFYSDASWWRIRSLRASHQSPIIRMGLSIWKCYGKILILVLALLMALVSSLITSRSIRTSLDHQCRCWSQYLYLY